jgi:hypothetical protein
VKVYGDKENRGPLRLVSEESLDIGIKWLHMASANRVTVSLAL